MSSEGGTSVEVEKVMNTAVLHMEPRPGMGHRQPHHHLPPPCHSMSMPHYLTHFPSQRRGDQYKPSKWK
jgi:hypothetical protein